MAEEEPNVQSGKNPFHINSELIQSIPENEQADELQELGLQVYDQDEFEQGIMAQVDTAMAKEEQERLRRILQKEQKAIQDDIKSTKQELENIEKVLNSLEPKSINDRQVLNQLKSVRLKKENKTKQLKRLRARQKALLCNATGNPSAVGSNEELDDKTATAMLEQALLGMNSAQAETEMEKSIRLGEMTPFGTAVHKQDVETTVFEKYLNDQKSFSSGQNGGKDSISKRIPKRFNTFKKSSTEEPSAKKQKSGKVRSKSKPSKKTSQESDLIDLSSGSQNFFDSKDKRVYRPAEKDFSDDRWHRRKVNYPKLHHNFSGDRPVDDYEVGDEDYEEERYEPDERDVRNQLLEDEESPMVTVSNPRKQGNDEDYIPTGEEDEDFDLGALKESCGVKKKKNNSRSSAVTKCKDDGNAVYFENRIKKWKMEKLQKKQEKIANEEEESDEEDMEFDGAYRVPGQIWNQLYRYQKTCVKWLWELHNQQAGGIIGDEMGLGKTIQMISFLAGLRYSGLTDKSSPSRYIGLGPTLIVCPTTVMYQWVKEFHKWYPQFRVAILHSSGSFTTSEANLVRQIVYSQGILVTAFSTVNLRQEILLEHDWHYVILDEGHKIRNPDAQVTLACKQFRSCHRIILSGSPIQNNLKELWSLFDFVFPGKLGTLPDFMSHFSVPIVQGGYSNATQVQVQTAYKCACVLRDTINPYLLRRMKADVKANLNLPAKNEQVLFCRLTDEQRDVYKEYLDSKECMQILGGNFMVFPGLITLRKICNHPDLSTGGPKIFTYQRKEDLEEDQEYGFWKRSGKMMVVASLLKLWKKQDHRVLLFTQSTQMLDILETFINKKQYTYMRMDGKTAIAGRQSLITKYNEDKSIFLFLLTTRVGGLGVNLTGANRIVIFDPDWNPSTDTQARERAWRIGQTKQVTIYRLITSGTIEEKIYHRQIFKTFLTNRVLKDPKQRRFFKANDMFELFTLGDDTPNGGSETSAIFAGIGSDVSVKPKRVKSSSRRNRFDELKEKKDKDKEKSKEEKRTKKSRTDSPSASDEDKLTKMKELAKRLSAKIGNGEFKKEANEKESSPGQSGSNSNGAMTVDLTDDKETSQTNGDIANDVQPSTSSQMTQDGNQHKDGKSRDKHKKRKKKRRRDAKFEGERINYLDKHRVYRDEEEEEQKDSKQNEYVLQRLFKKSGVQSAMQHDKIMMSSNPDYALVEGEAERVAKEAARAMKQSRAKCYSAVSGVPSFTGHSGSVVTATASAPKPRFGQKKNSKLVPLGNKKPDEKKATVSKPIPKKPEKVDEEKLFDGALAGTSKLNSSKAGTPDVSDSVDLLSQMRHRNHLLLERKNTGEEDTEGSAPVAVDTNSEQYELLTDIRIFVAFGGNVDGIASTQEILDQFESRLPANDSALFKSMLTEICDFEKRDGIGFWRLKPDFR